MVRHALPALCLLASLAACTDGGSSGSDLGPPAELELRSCKTELSYRPGRAVDGVAVGGEWNGFRPEEAPLVGPDPTGLYRAELELPKGVYGYKLVVTSGGAV